VNAGGGHREKLFSRHTGLAPGNPRSWWAQYVEAWTSVKFYTRIGINT
jgi:hypothetical protein